MQLALVERQAGRQAWAAGLTARLGVRPGDWLPIGEPAFLGQLAGLLGIAPVAGVLATAAGLLAGELGPEIPAEPGHLAAASLALEVATAAGRLLAFGSPGVAGRLALQASLQRAAGLLGQAAPQDPKRQRRLVEQATAPLKRLVRCPARPRGHNGSGRLAA